MSVKAQREPEQVTAPPDDGTDVFEYGEKWLDEDGTPIAGADEWPALCDKQFEAYTGKGLRVEVVALADYLLALTELREAQKEIARLRSRNLYSDYQHGFRDACVQNGIIPLGCAPFKAEE